MKKSLLTLSALFLLLFSANAQLPFGHNFIYEFTSGSNANTSVGSSVPDLSNGFNSITDRNNSAGDAASIGGSMSASLTSILATNTLSTSISFWMRSPNLISNKRLLQIYGPNGHGYRVETDGSFLYLNASVATLSGFQGGTFSTIADLDDNAWHHITILTYSNGALDEIFFNIYIDGSIQTITSGNSINPPGSTILEFVKDGNFVIDPLNAYTGDLDDIYFFKRTLNSTEITQLMNYTPAPPPTRYYVDVDATGNNDGSSWTDAFTDLQNAFASAYPGMEIWVADGTYTHAGTNRSLAFLWEVDSLKVYGGFNGTETMLSQRDWMANRTIMSGDIGTPGDNADNCYAVFVGPFGSSSNLINTALLDGFVIQDGNANANLAHVFGATGSAFYSVDYTSQMNFHNCEFSNNTAKYSAFFAFSDTKDVEVNVDACIFKNNEGRVGSAILAESHGENMFLNVTNSLFYDNESIDMGSLGTGLGAVVYLEAKNAVNTGLRANFINSTFVNNINSGTNASNFESTIVSYDAAAGGGSKHLDIDNCIFWGNSGDIYSVRENPNSNSSFNSIGIDNTLSEFTTFPTIATTINIISSNPMFTNIGNDDFTLQSNSPAIDEGSSTGLTIPNLDLAGNTRFVGTSVDMGCYESSCGITVSVGNTGDELNATPGFASYQWYLNNNAISGATSADFTPTENGLFYVEVGDGSGCTASTVPSLYCLAFPDVIITQNGTVLETASSFTTYDWSLDGVLIPGENSNTLTVTQDGEYKVEVTDQYGCGDFTSFNYCSALAVVITETNGVLSATSGLANYQWYLDGAAISGATSVTYTSSQDGIYTCEATDNGCTATSNAITIQTATGISTLAFDFLKVYPNPTQGILNIELYESINSIRLLSITGQVVAEFDANERSLDIAKYQSGIYFLELQNNDSKSIVKVILK